MLERLFTSKTRTEILKLLLFNQGKEYHLREISRLVKTNPTYVKKELDNLAGLNLIKKQKKANLSIYSLNEKCIFLEELKRIFIKTDYIGELIKKTLSDKARYVLIYGSFAKGTETESSDIDLLVISEMKEDNLIKIIQKIERETMREINYILWNEKTFNKRARGHHLLRTIKKDKVIMLIGDENEFRKKIR